MDVTTLESPLEALFFNNYVSTFGFFTTTVQSFWTFVAVLTAAISFWRIRAVGHCSISDHHVPVINSNGSSSSYDHHPFSSQKPHDQEPVVEEEEGVHHQVCSCTPSSSSSSSSSYGSAAVTLLEDGRVKGNKFMVHFYQDDEDFDGVNSNDAHDQLMSRDDEDEQEEDTVLLRVREVMYGGYCQTNWERVLQVRRSGDLGWYRYQDLTSLNGSVVKLWGRC